MAEAMSIKGDNTVRGARALGWVSIGLGAMELFAPEALGRWIGVRGRSTLIRAMGVREIASGIVILTMPDPAIGISARVGGDVLDLTLLTRGLFSRDTANEKLGRAVVIRAGMTAADVICATGLAHSGASVVETVQTIAVNRSPEECYRFWRDFENLPRFMKHVESVEASGDGRSHWVVKGPAGVAVEWDAELTEDLPNRIAWRSVPGGDIENSGSVEFRPATQGHGTIVRATVRYAPPAGAVGSAIAKLLGQEPSIQAKTELRRFKAVLETGEVPTIDGQSSGRA